MKSWMGVMDEEDEEDEEDKEEDEEDEEDEEEEELLLLLVAVAEEVGCIAPPLSFPLFLSPLMK